MSEDPRRELHELTAAARVHLEWYEATGVLGLPASLPQRRRDPEAEPRGPARAVAAPSVATPAARSVAVEVPLAEPRARPAPLPSAERDARLLSLAERVATCKLCELCSARKQTVFARGNPGAELMFVGEGPGADEDEQGQPFVGRAGQLLDRMVAGMGLTQQEVYIANVVKCRPPDNRTPQPNEMAACLPYLNEQIDLVRPKAIVALGGTALKGLLGGADGITRARGSWKLYRRTTPLMPTFHPAYLLRAEGSEERELKRKVWTDLQLVLKQLGRTPPKRTK